MASLKRLAALSTAALLTGAIVAPSSAADYPSRQISVIVPFPPGGSTDQAARVVAAEAEKRLGAQMIIENRAGATGNIGANAVAKAAPDGYTLLVAAISVFAINPALFKSLPYDAAKDFDLLTILVRTPNVLVVRKDFPANTAQEFVDYLKAHPGEVSMASSGAGSSDHLTAELFWQKTATKGNHVPYKGGAPAITDLVGGQVDASFQNLGAIYPHVKEGKVKALAVTGEARSDKLPDVPTMKEAGVEGVDVYSWQAIAAPKGLPADVKAKLQTELTAALQSEKVKAAFAKTGFEVVANTSEEFAALQAKEIARWKDVVAQGAIAAP